MRTSFLQFFQWPGRLLPLAAWSQLSGQRLILPFYHVVSDEFLPHISPLYPVRGVKQFEADLDTLCRHHAPLRVADLLAHLDGRPLRRPSFLLTFDDGLREMAEVVAPILQARGLEAIFFLNPPFLDNQALFYRYKVALLLHRLAERAPNRATVQALHQDLDAAGLPSGTLPRRLQALSYADQEVIPALAARLDLDLAAYRQQERPYLSSAQVRELQAAGFALGAHSWDHPHYAHLPLQAQLAQTRRGFQALQQRFGVNELFFAFPFTDAGVSEAFFQAVFAPGDEFALNLSLGTAGLKAPRYPRHRQRIPVEGTRLPLRHILAAEHTYYLLKRLAGRHRG